MKPILFNTEMVKAILDGRKTVTRRLIKPQPEPSTQVPLGYVSYMNGSKEDGQHAWGLDEYGGRMSYAKPPCKLGEILYVRETYASISDFVNYADYDIDSDLKYLFKCDDNGEEHAFVDIGVKHWRPSIHMPKEASRIFLRVTDVRVERLQDITEKDACKEGFHAGYTNVTSGPWGLDDCPDEWTATEEFSVLWNSTINKQDIEKYGWKANPWVWVIEFSRISKEEAQCYTL